MTSDSALYRDLAYVFIAALLGGVIAKQLRQPLVIGYVLGGIIIGPFTPGPTVSEIHVLELFAEIGVILLMYSLGIEFSLRDLLQVKWVSIIGGPLGIGAVIALALAAGRLMGWGILQSASIGAVLSLASTMVLTRLLTDRRELHSQHGRAMVGITLVDDLVFVFLTVLLPSLANISGSRLASIGFAFGKAFIILVPVAFIAAKLVPPLIARIPSTPNQELRLLVALGLGFATAAVTQRLGLSLALGAFLAGMVVSASAVAHETLADLLPLRNAFTALFFVTIGALVDPRALLSNPRLLATLVLLIVVGKFLIWAVVARLFRYPFRTAVLVGVGLTQIGEFSYVLVRVANNAKLVGADVYSTTLAASIVTILINALLIRIMPGFLDRFQIGQHRPAVSRKATR
jgi:monovalent cation:H+ antiporter-2, CPA2 family